MIYAHLILKLRDIPKGQLVWLIGPFENEERLMEWYKDFNFWGTLPYSDVERVKVVMGGSTNGLLGESSWIVLDKLLQTVGYK